MFDRSVAEGMDWPWRNERRDLPEWPDKPAPCRVIACLNYWNDVDELKYTVPSWRDHVDRIIAVDGAYEGMPGAKVPESTDGSTEYLQSIGCEIVAPVGGFCKDQATKRSRYFRHGDDLISTDVYFVIDADEYVWNAEALRSLPARLDVGWVRIYSPLYGRGQDQPRLFRWRSGLHYAGRHHWVYDRDEYRSFDNLVASHQIGGAGLEHVVVDLDIFNSRGQHRAAPRQLQSDQHRAEQFGAEEREVGPSGLGFEPLRILHMGPFDPGLVMYRLHTAINACTPHESAIATHDNRPLREPYQFDFDRDRQYLADLYATADIVHLHVNRAGPRYIGFPLDVRPTVMHHHGTEFRIDPKAWNDRDRDDGIKLRLISNLELMQYAEDLHWLPNPIPWRRYARIGNRHRPSWKQKPTFRVGHSPTKRDIKGTPAFLRACDRLRAAGMPIEPVLIEGQPIQQSLEIKATCHVFFDSFWLGLQCSGLEAGAMGIPVIAGDPDVAREYRERVGYLPYVYANNESELAGALTKLYESTSFYSESGGTISTYVRDWHDLAAVAGLYLDLLDTAFEWRQGLRLGASLPLSAP